MPGSRKAVEPKGTSAQGKSHISAQWASGFHVFNKVYNYNCHNCLNKESAAVLS
jgi:hypothetical protein